MAALAALDAFDEIRKEIKSCLNDEFIVEACASSGYDKAIEAYDKEIERMTREEVAHIDRGPVISLIIAALDDLGLRLSHKWITDSDVRRSMTRALYFAPIAAEGVNDLARSASLSTSAHLIDSYLDDNEDISELCHMGHLARRHPSLREIYVVVTGILTHDLALSCPVSISTLLLHYIESFEADHHHELVVCLAQHTPILINLLALSNHTQKGLNLTSCIIEMDDIAIVNDWAVEARHQMQSSQDLAGVDRLAHLTKCSILNHFFEKHTGSPIQLEESDAEDPSDLPTVDAPEWFKEQSAKVASTQKVYSSNEFRTLRMAAQGIRAPSKHVDSFE
ncbi:hypothetical protein E3P99_00794 [Wallemia hederae]|uniref:Uncharacterized protein n=1 Tax=Wallemia hederae TaxID=1540922 RepID=A0A4T0FTQ4_9BASI|nr:hypothetical protein E3P99_00794 [Wallemia hederae]